MRVTMVNSVGEYVAGEEVELPDEISDRFIVLGYADGHLSREISEEERAEMLADHQVVEA